MSEIQPIIHQNIPSPFCGIASDDLTIEVRGLNLRVIEGGDSFSRRGFEQPLTDLYPRLGGRLSSLEQAIAEATRLLRASRLPVFSGFGTDVNDTRAALSLIERCRGVFDQGRATASLRNLLVLADSGWMTTTLAEVRNRAEVLVAFGTDIATNFPRFFERFLWPEETLFGADSAGREIIFIGEGPSSPDATAPDGRCPSVIPCDKSQLPRVAAALSALAGGARLQAESVGGIAVADLRRVVERLRAASYSVIAWSAGKLDYAHAELTVQQLCRTVVALNRETRCGGLPLGGHDGDRTASQVAAWITGYPTRVSFARGYPEFDPYHFDTERLLACGEADLLVWVSSLGMNPPPVVDTPTIVIGRSGMTFEREPEIFIPVGVPGIDFRGHMYRSDSVVALPLYQLRDSGLSRAASVLADIEAGL